MTKTPLKLAAMLALGFLLFAPAALAQEKSAKEVQVGDTSIELPALDGFQELYGRSTDFDKIIEHFVPAGNKLLAVYVSDSDVKALNENPQAGMKRYMLVQTPDHDVSVDNAGDFAGMKDDFARQVAGDDWQSDKSVADQMQSVSGYLRDNFDKQADMKVGETKFLGKLGETPDSLSVMILTKYGVTTKDGTKDYPVIAALSVLRLNARVVFSFNYANYTGGADLDFVSQTARQFVTSALALNGGDTGKDEGPGLGDAFGWATKGAILIILLAIGGLVAVRIAQGRGKDEIR